MAATRTSYGAPHRGRVGVRVFPDRPAFRRGSDCPGSRHGGRSLLGRGLHRGPVGDRRRAPDPRAGALRSRPDSDAASAGSFLFFALVVGGPWAAGRAIRRRRASEHRLERRAVAAEREREARAREAVAEERARIARELHDVVAHGMGVIVIQARRPAGPRREPDQARRSFDAIEATGRAGIAEMRRLLDVLRGTDESVARAATEPRHVVALVEQVRAAGLPVELRVEGQPRGLPRASTCRRTASCRRRSPTRSSTPAVRARTRPPAVHRDGLEVEVTDDGSRNWRRRAPRGHGLIGMRERVALFGGSWRTGASRGRRTGCVPACRSAVGPDMTIRVLIADDQELVRTGLRMILTGEPDIEVVGEAADGARGGGDARALRPDVVLHGHPDAEARRPRGYAPDPRPAAAPPVSLVLTTFDLDEYVYEALRAGASGFLLKDAPAEQLVAAIRAAAAGDALLAPSVTRRLIERVRPSWAASRPRRWLARAHRARARGAAAAGPRAVQRRDRERALRRRGDGQDARRAAAGEARRPRPRPGGGAGLRVRPRPPGSR